jgi:hypothetical protein
MARFYPQALGSLFVTSYNSQGYAGGIRQCFNTGFSYLIPCLRLSLMLRSTVSRPVCLGVKAPFGDLRPDLYYCLTLAGLLIWGALSDEKVGLSFALLLAFTRAVIFGSESPRTRGHILLSQIRDFPFRRLIRLAGLRWRYSTQPPYGGFPCLSLSLMLRPTVSRPLCLGIKHHSGAYDQVFIIV